jgi:hypothetical protein
VSERGPSGPHLLFFFDCAQRALEVITTNPLTTQVCSVPTDCSGCGGTIPQYVPFMAIDVEGTEYRYCPKCLTDKRGELYEAYRKGLPAPNIPLPGINDDDEGYGPRTVVCWHCHNPTFDVSLLDVEPWRDTLEVDPGTGAADFTGPERIPQGGAEVIEITCPACHATLWSNPYA